MPGVVTHDSGHSTKETYMSDMRQDLAEIIESVSIIRDKGEQRNWETRKADAILASGYRKPRTIKSYDELCALPYGSAVQTSDTSDTVVLRSDGMDFVNQSGHTVTAPVLWDFGSKPFVVLYEPAA